MLNIAPLESISTVAAAIANSEAAKQITAATAPTWAAIRAAMPEYFSKDASLEFDALSDKNQKFAPLAMSLTGHALERAYSGSTSRMGTLKATATASKKGHAMPTRAIISTVEEIKPQSIKGMTLHDVTEYAELFFVGALATFAPTVKAKPEGDKAPTALQTAKFRIAELETQLAECMAECAMLKRTAPQTATV